jgi:hypothetical protein
MIRKKSSKVMPHNIDNNLQIQQLDFLLESSEDLIMIDDGPGRLIEWIIKNNKLNNTPEDICKNISKSMWPIVTYCSPSWCKFGYHESLLGKYIVECFDLDGPIIFISKLLYQLRNKNIEPVSQTIMGKTSTGIRVESILSPMGDKILSITRNIEDRLQKQELQVEIAKQQVAREKDEQANSFDRHETKNGLLSASAQVDLLMRIHKEAEKDNTLYNITHQEEVYGIYNELSYDLEQTLQTVLSNAMTREIIHNTYKPNMISYDILSIKQRVKGNNIVWNIFPKSIPEILMDECLFFYIIRNAVSNAYKYGLEDGNITISISIKNTLLEVIIENEPGIDHEDLIKLDNPNKIFEKGTKFHKQSKIELNKRSSGDGAWIMNTCANLLDGSCNIRFTESKTVFTFKCNITTCATDLDIINFTFPINTQFYIIDDSKMQRKVLHRTINNLGIPDENITIKGSDMNEILSLETLLTSKIVENKKYNVIICDENLDYKDIRSNGGIIYGTQIWDKIKKNVDDSNTLFLTRSANDSSKEIEYYLSIVDGIISKKVSNPVEFKNIIAKIWLKKIGVSTPSNIVSTFSSDLADIIDIYMEDLNEFLLLESSKCTWEVFWSELHKIKGSIQSLNEIINSEDVVRLIEKLRGNEFDETYDEKWAIVKQGLTDYHRKILMYLQTHGNNQISA